MSPIALLEVKRGIHNPTHTGAFNLLQASNNGEQTISLWNLLQLENWANNSLLCSQGETENNRPTFCLQQIFTYCKIYSTSTSSGSLCCLKKNNNKTELEVLSTSFPKLFQDCNNVLHMTILFIHPTAICLPFSSSSMVLKLYVQFVVC